jgi:hypothetical protein
VNARGRIITAMSNEAIGSACWKPVSRITSPATIANTDPRRSAITSMSAPRRLSEPVSERLSTAIETPLATRPVSANSTIGPASTSPGSARRETPATSSTAPSTSSTTALARAASTSARW